MFCDFITFLPFSHQVILPRGLNPWAPAIAAFFLEKCSQSSTCCHLCKLCPSFSYQCMCSRCMPLVTVRLFATNLESKFKLSQGLLSFITSNNTLCILFAIFQSFFFFFLRYKLTKVYCNNAVIVLMEQSTNIIWFISTRIIIPNLPNVWTTVVLTNKQHDMVVVFFCFLTSTVSNSF